MSRFASIVTVAAAGLALAGCTHRDPAPNLDWTFQADAGDGAKLAYGQPRSDNVVLMMTCAPGSSRVRLSALSARPSDTLVLATADGRERFAGRAEPDVIGAGHLVEAQAGADAASLRVFAETGELALMDGSRWIDLPASAGEQAGVRDFFETCQA